jgi:hypothetical protein
MDMGFAVIGPLARRRMPRIRFLYIGSCVCPRFFQTFRCRHALALRYDFIRLSKGLSPSSCRTCSAHREKPRTSGRGFPSLVSKLGSASVQKEPYGRYASVLFRYW